MQKSLAFPPVSGFRPLWALVGGNFLGEVWVKAGAVAPAKRTCSGSFAAAEGATKRIILPGVLRERFSATPTHA